MKKILGSFLTFVVLLSVLCTLPISATSDYGIWYTKVGNSVIIDVKGLGTKTADFYAAVYKDKQMTSVERFDIKNDSYTSDVITMIEGYDYKFFVWENTGTFAPIFNHLHLNTHTENGTGTSSNVNLLTAQGRIIEAYGISLSADDEVYECGVDEIKVETRSGIEYFNIGKLDIAIEDYLGRSVDIRYKNTDGINYVSDIDLQIGKNQTYTLMLDYKYHYNEKYCIDEYSYSSSSISFESDDGYTEIDISLSASVLLNYKATSDSFDVVLDENINKIGYVTVVCSGSNLIADVVFVNTFDTVIVASVEDNVIYAKNTKETYQMDITDVTKDISIKRNGIECPLSSICENDVLSICQSPDKKYTRILVSNEKVEGILSEAFFDDKTYRINGKVYTYSPVCYGVYGQNKVPGFYESISAVADSFGLIAYIYPDEEPYKSETQPLAVVTGTGRYYDVEYNDVGIVVYFIQGGENRSYRCRYDISESDFNILETDTGDIEKGDIFWYKLDEDGKICECMIIYDKSAETLTPTASEFTVEDDNVAFVYGALDGTVNGLTFAKSFDSYGNANADSALHIEYANVLDATHARDDGSGGNSDVEMIRVTAIRGTSKYSEIYTAVVKVNEKGRAEDIVQYIITDSALTGWTSVDAVINEKLTY